MNSRPLPPAPLLPVPSKRQLAWSKLKYYAFVHFGPNTFTDREWGLGSEPASAFNPTHLDCLQWAKAFKAAGMKGIVITAKHHDGFCLWPSAYSTHTVAKSPWRDGHGDVLADLSKACKEVGLKFGVYLSPWDRNHPAYGTPEYNQVYVNMLHEVLTHYGPVFEMWFDGANGEGPNGKKQVYDWPLFRSTVRKLQPNAVMFSDAGPDIRWVGNEEGVIGDPNWDTLNADQFYPGTPNSGPLNQGQEGGKNWLPGETNTSIRPGWFFHPEEDSKVKSVSDLMGIWFTSVGRGSNLILNVPPNREGLISQVDIDHLNAFAAERKLLFGKWAAVKSVEATSSRGEGFEPSLATSSSMNRYWANPDGQLSASLTFDLGKDQSIDVVQLKEAIQLGQRIRKFTISAWVKGGWVQVGEGTTVGAERLYKIDPVSTSKVKIDIVDSRACPTLTGVRFYKTPAMAANAATVVHVS